MSKATPNPTVPVAAKAPTILRAHDIHRAFRMGESSIAVLKGVDLTLRHIMGALDDCDEGVVEFEGLDLTKQNVPQRSRLRNKHFGFIFQFYHLLPELNVLENTLLAPMIELSWLNFWSQRQTLRDKATDLLTQLGMSHRLKHRPAQLSGGERQRVAIARALMNDPKVLFADEPTGKRDGETGRHIMTLLERLHRDSGQTIVMVTHDRALARE